MIDRCFLTVPYPKEESRLLAPIRPFQPTVRQQLRIGDVNLISN